MEIKDTLTGIAGAEDGASTRVIRDLIDEPRTDTARSSHFGFPPARRVSSYGSAIRSRRGPRIDSRDVRETPSGCGAGRKIKEGKRRTKASETKMDKQLVVRGA